MPAATPVSRSRPRNVNGRTVIEELFIWPMTFALLANGPGADTIQGEPDLDFFITHLGIIQTGDFRIAITKTGSNATLTNAPVLGRSLLGPLDRPGMFPRPIFLRGGASLRVDVTDVSGAVNALDLSFIGYRRYTVPGKC